MARYDHLPIWATALGLAVRMERAVARFPRAHRYALGSDLRSAARQVCRAIVAANAARDERPQRVEALAWRIDDLRLLIQLGKELRVFASFAEFEDIARSLAELGKQCGGWLRAVRAKG